MKSLNIHLHFIEPFRMAAWTAKKHRTGKNRTWRRGQGFARWHKDRTAGDGRPYITGTLLRSAIIRAIEEELFHSQGKWMGIPCCAGLFFTKKNGQVPPKHLRHRATLHWRTEKKQTPCAANARDQACPLCLVLGRMDTATRRSGKDGQYDVRFGNLDPVGKPLWGKPEEIGQLRTLNRVDARTGKAHDYFRIYEINDVRDFKGTIELADDLPHLEKIIALLKHAAGFVATLCGATCTITVDAAFPLPAKPESPGTVDIISKVSGIMHLLHASRLPRAKLRMLADAVRALRRQEAPSFSLPPGHLDREGRRNEHYIWDITLDGGTTLREQLKKLAEATQNNSFLFRTAFEELGQAIYRAAKGETALLEPPALRSSRISGVVHVNDHVPSYNNKAREAGTKTTEWIITGRLLAVTPFFIGMDQVDNDHTSQRILLDRQFHYRLPRSVLRGILRHDLGLAYDGRGCRAELGLERPCLCPVCQLMRRIFLLDSISASQAPPDIRHRIRRAPHYGIARDTSLFDSECGLQGVSFPFVLRYRGDATLPGKLQVVLTWWQDKKLLLGGNRGTGKGRFRLTDLQVFPWKLSSEDERKKYAACCGFRGKEDQLDSCLSPGQLPQASAEYPWQDIPWTMEFKGPVLSADPVEALAQDKADSIFYQKTVLQQDGGTSVVPTLRGESLRGLLRTAVARVTGKDLLTRDHVDCRCALCEMFGNEHHAGCLRFEDMEPPPTAPAKRIDHISIDRFDQSVVEKFDDRPLIGSPDQPLTFSGSFWVKKTLSQSCRDLLAKAFNDLGKGLYPVGGRGGIGYGAVTAIHLPADWRSCFQAEEESPENLFHSSDDVPLPPEPQWKPEENAIYNPYYFISPGSDEPVRTFAPVSHATLQTEKITGRLTCTLTTLSPLLLPDTEKTGRLEGEPAAHQEYNAFRLNKTIIIPGSQIRAAVSQIFETLTNSCFRVMDQKRKLSWRMTTEDYLGNNGNTQQFHAGRVSSDGQSIIKMQSVRLPLYDEPGLTKSIKIECLWDEKDRTYQKTKTKKALQHNRQIAEAAGENKKLYKTLSEKQQNGLEQVRFRICTLSSSYSKKTQTETIIDQIAILDPQGTCTGYLKITGPNNAEVDDTGKEKGTKKHDSWCTCDEHNLTIRKFTHNDCDCLVSNQKTYPRPLFRCEKDNVVYTVTKRCERIFYGNKNERVILTPKNHRQYRSLVRETIRNSRALPKPFRSRISQTLHPGTLVYFNQQGERIDTIIPVSLFRLQDDRFLGRRLREGFRPCASVCLEDCDQCTARTCPLPLYREGYPDRGLCRACRLFGTQMYRGRVRFGFAAPQEGTLQTKKVSLPLQERPRPTWVLPREVKNTAAEIPGRKFYLRHDGWKTIWDHAKKPGTGEPVQQTKNTITIREGITPEQSFEFFVDVENLTREELGQLIYSLQLEKNMAHSLGRGKPFGFGQVTIQVTAFEQRLNSGRWENIPLPKKPAVQWAPVAEGLRSLSQVTGNTWYKLPYISALRLMLTRITSLNSVYYPQLAQSVGTNLPGYIELKRDDTYDPRYHLTIHPEDEHPVLPWYPVPKKQPCSHNGEYHSKQPKKSSEQQEDVHTGTVKWFNEQKGYGFILSETGQNLFVHYTEIMGTGFKSLEQRQKVQFEIGKGRKGKPAAMNVRKIP